MANVKSALNVREDASQETAKVGKLYKDCGGTILERRDGWTKLRSGNVIGWASDEYLLFGEEALALANDVGKMIATVNTETLRESGQNPARKPVYTVFCRRAKFWRLSVRMKKPAGFVLITKGRTVMCPPSI